MPDKHTSLHRMNSKRKDNRRAKRMSFSTQSTNVVFLQMADDRIREMFDIDTVFSQAVFINLSFLSHHTRDRVERSLDFDYYRDPYILKQEQRNNSC